MQRISSKLSYFHIWVIPTLALGVVSYIAVTALIDSGRVLQQYGTVAMVINILLPLAFLTFSYFFFKQTRFHLIANVEDYGDHLLIRGRGQEYKIPIKQISDLKYDSAWWSRAIPRSVTLNISSAITLGSQVSFIPPWHQSSYRKHPLIESLVQRIEQERLKNLNHRT